MDKLAGWSGERLRTLRSIEVLESIATADAKKVLDKLAHGSPKARITQEANTSLARLENRPYLSR
jgi:hypothetical protein